MIDTKKSMFVPVNTPRLNGNEAEYVLDCIETGWISSEGSYVAKFEDAFSAYVGRKFGVAVSSGSAALEVALKVAGVKEGDEVILPSFTIMSCLAPILRSGAIPVFVDSDLDTWNMKAEDVAGLINAKTKVILAVHIYGLPCDVEKLAGIAREHNIFMIEDAAEMHGQTVGDQMCGSFGDVSIFSFYPNKQITTGEGGMIVTNSKELAKKSKWYANLCFGEGDQRYEHHDLGWNFRMTNMQAAIGCAQLENVTNIVTRKRLIGHRYNIAFSHLTHKFQLPLQHNQNSENIYWVYGMLVKDGQLERFTDYLTANNIGHRRFFYPLHRQPIYKKLVPSCHQNLPISEQMHRKGVYIPSGLGMTDDQQEYVINKIQAYK